MGIFNLVNKMQETKKERARVEREEQEIKLRLEQNPRFKGMDVDKIEFVPVDGDVDRMKIYGCYAGDKFIYEGKEHTVEKDDVERVTFYPSSQYNQDENEAKRRMYLGEFKYGDRVENQTYAFTYKRAYFPLYHDHYMEDSPYDYKAMEGWHIKCIDKETPMENVVMPDTFLGIKIKFIENCFENCHNLKSVSHIPTYIENIATNHQTIGRPEDIAFKDTFKDCGLITLPDISSFSLHRSGAIKSVESNTNDAPNKTHDENDHEL
jgi:hypothetical protein